MAYETGTATNFLDLYTKLRDFLTTNADLVTANQNWEVVTGPASGPLAYTDEILFKGPGTAGNDEILVSTHVSFNAVSDYYNLGFAGYSSYNPGLPLEDQANRLQPRFTLLSNGSMPYWFVANGRRFLMVVRIGSIYESAYCGFILPYHLPTTWDYPLLIGATVSYERRTLRYSVVSGYHASFFNPAEDSTYIRLTDGIWTSISNLYQPSSESWLNVNNTSPWHQYFRIVNNANAIDGSAVLQPGEIAIKSPYPAVLGAMQGVWYASGFGVTPENTVTVGGVTHVMIPNVHRVDINNYMALALE